MSALTPDHVSTPTDDLMLALGARTDAISAAIPTGAAIAFVDYPLHINVGDLLILLGAMDFFDANRNVIGATSSVFDTGKRALEAMEATDVIVCHGGGNFGDIYPRHQMLRETILKAFPDKPIVIMPQSISFGSEAALEQSAAIFRRHADVTLFVRDAPSFEIARKHFSEKVQLMPDMAHRLHDRFAPWRGRADKAGAPFSLIRRDVEATSDLAEGADWRDMVGFIDKIRMGRHRLLAQLRGRLNHHDAKALTAYRSTTHALIDTIADQFTASGPWKTNRLHGAIFGLLMGKDVTLMDNSYGKNSRYFRQWDPDAKLIGAL